MQDENKQTPASERQAEDSQLTMCVHTGPRTLRPGGLFGGFQACRRAGSPHRDKRRGRHVQSRFTLFPLHTQTTVPLSSLHPSDAKGAPPLGSVGLSSGAPGISLERLNGGSHVFLFSKWPESRITASVPHVLALLFFSGGLREDDAPPHVLRRYDCITLTDRAECVLRLPVNLSPNKAVGLRRSHRLSADHSCCFFFSGCNCSYSAVIMDFNGSPTRCAKQPPGRLVGVCVSSEVVLSTR